MPHNNINFPGLQLSHWYKWEDRHHYQLGVPCAGHDSSTGMIFPDRARNLIPELCKAKEIETIPGHIWHDHVHQLTSVSIYISIIRLVQYLKGKTSRKIIP